MFGSNSNLDLLKTKKYATFVFSDDFLQSDQYRIEHDVMILDNFVKHEFCDAILNRYKGIDRWQKSKTYGEIDGATTANESPRQSREISLTTCMSGDTAVHKVINSCLQVYIKEYRDLEVVEDEGYSLLEYSEGGEYKIHVDKSQRNSRILSALIYLNDDYEGGGLYFPRQDLTVKPKKGTVVLFPSGHTHPHACMPVTRGKRYAIVTWFK